MKKTISILILTVLLIFSLTGCQKQIEKKETKSDNISVEKVEKKDEIKTVKASDIDPRTSEYPTLLKEFSFDFDQDNKEEKIQLYTAAGKDSKGNMMWDDGQKWLLVAVDENKYYTLYSEYVQLGQVYFTVSTVGEEKTPNVTIMLPNHCGIQILKCTFDKQNESFMINKAYDTSDENVLFISVPGY